MLVGISGKIGSGKDTVAQIIQYLVFCDNNPEVKKDFTEWITHPVDYEETSNWQNKKFADKLKDIVCLLLNCTRQQLEDREFKEKELGEEWWRYKQHDGPVYRYISKESYNSLPESVKNSNDCFIEKLTPRKILQLLGTECGRDIIHPNIWVNALMSDYKKQGSVANLSESELEFLIKKGIAKFPNWIITDMRFPNELKAVKSRGGITIRVHRGSGIYTPKIEDLHPSETALDNAEFDYVIDNNGSIEDLVEKVKQLNLI